MQAIETDTERLQQDTVAFKSAVEATVIPRMFQATGFSDNEVRVDTFMYGHACHVNEVHDMPWWVCPCA